MHYLMLNITKELMLRILHLKQLDYREHRHGSCSEGDCGHRRDRYTGLGSPAGQGHYVYISPKLTLSFAGYEARYSTIVCARRLCSKTKVFECVP